MMNRSVRSILVMLALVLALAEPVPAGGPSPDQRNEVLGICPQSDTNISQTCNLADGSLVCDTAATACGVTTPFSATLVVSVTDDPPCDNDQTLACGVDNPDANCPGLTSTKGTTTVTLMGRRRKNKTLDKGGRPFTLSQTFSSCDFPGTVCAPDPCDVTFTAFCCFAVRMTEKSLPQASELVYRPGPASQPVRRGERHAGDRLGERALARRPQRRDRRAPEQRRVRRRDRFPVRGR